MCAIVLLSIAAALKRLKRLKIRFRVSCLVGRPSTHFRYACRLAHSNATAAHQIQSGPHGCREILRHESGLSGAIGWLIGLSSVSSRNTFVFSCTYRLAVVDGMATQTWHRHQHASRQNWAHAANARSQKRNCTGAPFKPQHDLQRYFDNNNVSFCLSLVVLGPYPRSDVPDP